MPEGKYAKYILPAPIMRDTKRIKEGYNFKSVFAHDGELNADIGMGFHYMNEHLPSSIRTTHPGHEDLSFWWG